MQSLAVVNDSIYNYLSFPLTIFLFMHIQGVIAVSSMIMAFFEFSHPENLSYTIYPTITWFCIGYLIWMNTQIRQIFEHICVVLKEKYEFSVSARSTTQARRLWHRESLPRKPSSPIQLHEIDLYKAYFQLRLHHLVRLDFAILLHIFLFVLNQIVFIYQTN